MFARLKRLFRYYSWDGPQLTRLMDSMAPIPLSTRVVAEGQEGHDHVYSLVKWPRDLLGQQYEDFDEATGDPFSPPRATEHQLFVCPCGKEEIRSVRWAY